ncbi:hypothetical protein B0T24DRAFT_401837 [Lasiosphaeria ovina]|uniref:Uncharacterized protein n=1 Tax=Lasiosphaeria ovina TaxID=92902 RepID=A0AAE0N1B6_9PEZI|nr:hypothetical protein B0T24DRAFT_401837 [Lasiosphaeria ovina]
MFLHTHRSPFFNGEHGLPGTGMRLWLAGCAAAAGQSQGRRSCPSSSLVQAGQPSSGGWRGVADWPDRDSCRINHSNQRRLAWPRLTILMWLQNTLYVAGRVTEYMQSNPPPHTPYWTANKLQPWPRELHAATASRAWNLQRILQLANSAVAGRGP